jgi:homocitrate synthase NifV
MSNITQPYLIDSTLRDGEQSPGVVFDLKDKLRIAAMLDAVGVEELETGTPAMGNEEMDDMRTISQSGFRFRTLAWCRATEKDILMTAKTGTDGVHISFPASSLHMQILEKNKQWVIDTLLSLSKVARDHFSYFSIGAQDASRAETGFLTEFALCATAVGARRIRIADTVGLLYPLQVQCVFQRLSSLPDVAELEFHGHNDLGMATANTVTALMSGATCASVTVNGLGERAGNAPLEEVIMAMQLQQSQLLHYDTSHLGALAQLVEKLSGQKLSASKPITGAQVFRHESGIHVNGLLTHPGAYQIIDAQRVGKIGDEFVFGKHSGINGLMDLAEKAGISDVDFTQWLRAVRKRSVELKRELSAKEVLHILQDEFAGIYGL